MNNAYAPVGTQEEAELVAELNELLQLDYDAVAAYALALNGLEDPGYQDAVRRFKADHDRHTVDLTALVLSYGGDPVATPTLSGAFKLAVQSAGNEGGDAAIIRAFKANETQARAKYRRAASRQHPADVQGILIRAARDEQRHFDWAMRTLAELGDVFDNNVADALEHMHAHTSERAMQVAEYTRRSLRDSRTARVAAGGLMLLGAAALVSLMIRRD
ncbi:MAG TPA: DUF2383 domain-containing protein [Longimicrobiales bacterium]